MRCSSSFIRTLDTPVDAGQLLVRVHAAVPGVGFPVGRQKRLLVRQHDATLLGGVTDLGLGDLLVASTIERRIDSPANGLSYRRRHDDQILYRAGTQNSRHRPRPRFDGAEILWTYKRYRYTSIKRTLSG